MWDAGGGVWDAGGGVWDAGGGVWDAGGGCGMPGAACGMPGAACGMPGAACGTPGAVLGCRGRRVGCRIHWRTPLTAGEGGPRPAPGFVRPLARPARPGGARRDRPASPAAAAGSRAGRPPGVPRERPACLHDASPGPGPRPNSRRENVYLIVTAVREGGVTLTSHASHPAASPGRHGAGVEFRRERDVLVEGDGVFERPRARARRSVGRDDLGIYVDADIEIDRGEFQVGLGRKARVVLADRRIRDLLAQDRDLDRRVERLSVEGATDNDPREGGEGALTEWSVTSGVTPAAWFFSVWKVIAMAPPILCCD